MIDQNSRREMPIRGRRKANLWILPLFYILSFFWMEAVFRIAVYKHFFAASLFWSTLFILVTGFLFAVLTTLFNERKINHLIACILVGSQFLIFGIQLIYYKVFLVPFTASSFGAAGEVFAVKGFVIITLKTVFAPVNLFTLLLLAIPLALLIAFGRKKLDFRRTKIKPKTVLIAATLATYLLSLLFLAFSGNDPTSAKNLYFNINAPEMAQEKLGCMLNMRLDIQRLLFGFEEKGTDVSDPTDTDNRSSESPNPSATVTPEPTVTPIAYGDNAMSIDFAALAASESDSTLKSMHEYFASLTPTKKNEMTGIFEGCNFIFLTAESFSRYLVMYPDLFPTITKMVTEGLEFTNFYTSAWGVSTTDGEYVATTGLIPKSGVRSYKLSSKNYMPFAMGTQFKKIGYADPYAFHNHTYAFYQREQSHPNMGYNYLGWGNGIEKLVSPEGVSIKKTWPESDLQMMQVTLPLYINESPFHAYYMTVSGHQLYTFTGNYMAGKHKEEVANLDLPDNCKAYLAANLELEAALTYLCDELEKVGKLENTVFVMSADHYPYGLTNEEISAFLGHTVDPTFELYKSNLIIWKPGMAHQEIDTPMSSLDIMPTISNMFCLEFDSRLFIGQDIFAGNAEPLVIFNTRSWISEKCSYNAKTKEIVSFTGEQISDEYVSAINKRISNKFKYSALILDKDYYRKVVK